jgi:hypothetical protein
VPELSGYGIRRSLRELPHDVHTGCPPRAIAKEARSITPIMGCWRRPVIHPSRGAESPVLLGGSAASGMHAAVPEPSGCCGRWRPGRAAAAVPSRRLEGRAAPVTGYSMPLPGSVSRCQGDVPSVCQ